MNRLLRSLLALAACLGLVGVAAGKAAAATYPAVTKVSPLKLGVGDAMIVTGKNFRTGTGRNTVVLKRTGGRAVFVRAGKATRTKLSVKIPPKLLTSLARKAGKPIATRFRVRVLAGRLGRRYTATRRSPMIGPITLVKKATPADCDGDLKPNSTDADDDNDLLSDTLEATLKTDACKRDSDGDGMSDGWEHESALDYNGRAVPVALKRPYPNALDAKDGGVDADGDGLTNALEYAAWATFGGNRLPLSYSGGEAATGGKRRAPAGQEWFDRDASGFLSDNERDADGDGLPNQDEGGVDPLPVLPNVTGFFSEAYIGLDAVRKLVDVVPLYGPLPYVKKVQGTDWLDRDSDGDTVEDGGDDQDGDGSANLPELLTELGARPDDKQQRPLNACVPSTDVRTCLVGDDDIDNDGRTNRDDDDDDGDRLSDVEELQFGLNPYLEDTDGDAVGDGFEFYSAKDLNNAALPYPGKQPYPNALDKEDAAIDHDGDGLTLVLEYRAWRYTGAPVPLSYSDGVQRSGGQTALDSDRDVDDDQATNSAEAVGPLSGRKYWEIYVAETKVGCDPDYVETQYAGPKYEGLNFVDPDSDGDGLKDGLDDIDHDGLDNRTEGQDRRANWCSFYVSVNGSARNGGDPGARIEPFNPCKPYASDACHKIWPFGYYAKTETWAEDWKGPPAP